MANRQVDVDLRETQVSSPVNTLALLGLAWLGLAVMGPTLGLELGAEASVTERERCCAQLLRNGQRKVRCNVGVPTTQFPPHFKFPVLHFT